MVSLNILTFHTINSQLIKTLHFRIEREDEGEYIVTVRGRRNDGGYLDRTANVILTMTGMLLSYV